MFYDILDTDRSKILPFLHHITTNFYLAGGTALALYIGHRDSIDFNFFTEKTFDQQNIFETCQKILSEYTLRITQQEPNTLSVVINDVINMSFFTHTYPLLLPLTNGEYCAIASIQDIACMKILAIVNRSTTKDYVDLYYIFQQFSLDEVLHLTQKKYPHLDTNIILKSLVYFDDIIDEPIIFKNDKSVSVSQIKEVFTTLVKNYIKNT